jgi:hypothetical protein
MPRNPCALGSEILSLTYVGRTRNGRHRFNVQWRLGALPRDIMSCNDGTRVELTVRARYVGGETHERSVDVPSRFWHIVRGHGSVVISLPAVGRADVTSARAKIYAVTRVRQVAELARSLRG